MRLSKIYGAFLVAATLLATQAEAQTVRYRDRLFSASTSSTVSYGTATNVMAAPQTLNMTVYTPTGDVMTNRPAVLVFFGGGFVSGARTDANVVAFCDSLVARGYVAIAADYRIGVLAASTPEVERAIYRATQDVKAALRYVRANHITLGVDPARVYCGGFSAGAISSVMAEFWDQNEVNPANVDPAIMGTLNASGNSIVGDGRPSGIISVAGGIPNLSWMSAGNKLLAMAHSAVDPVVPCVTAPMAVINEPISGSCDMLAPATALGYQATLRPLNPGHLPSVGGADWSAMVPDLIQNRLYPNVVSNLSAAPVVLGALGAYSLEDLGLSAHLLGASIRVRGTGFTGTTQVYANDALATSILVEGDTVVYAKLPSSFTSNITNITVSKNLISGTGTANIQSFPLPTSVWTGAVNSNWNEPGNWENNAVPSTTSNVIIEDAINPLVITSSSNVEASVIAVGYMASLTIEEGAVAKSGGIVLNSKANIHHNSTLRSTPNSEDFVVFPNSKARGGATPLGNLWVHKDLELNGNVTVRGSIRMEQANSNGNGNIRSQDPSFPRVLTLESGPNYQGKISSRFGRLTLNNSSGVSLKLQLKVPGNTPAWYNLANPLQNQTLQDLRSNVTVTGSFPGATATHNPSVYYYDPTATTLNGYVIPTDITNSFSSGIGIRAWLWPSFFNGGGTFTYNGTYASDYNGPVFTSLGYCPTCLNGGVNGWNLVGNPFLTDIKFSNTNGLNRANQYWVANKGVFAQWDADLEVGINGANGIIGFGQGYFVKALAPGAEHSLLAASQDTSTRTPNIMRNQPRQLVRLSLAANGYVSDEAVTVFASGLNDSFVAAEDGEKMTLPNTIAVAFVAQGKNLGIQAQSEILNQSRTLPLSITSPNLNVNLTMTELELFGPGTLVYLVDKQTQTRTLLTTGQAQNLQLNQQVENNRFELLIVPATVTSLPGISSMALELYPNPASESVMVSGLAEAANVTVLDARGASRLQTSVVPGQPVNISELPAGTYMLRVQTSKDNTVLKFVKR